MKAADRAAAESVIREATLLYPEGCDLVISAIAAAARHHRRPTVCVPFPPGLFVRDSGERNYEVCSTTISSLPSVASLQGKDTLSEMPDVSIQLLAWLLGNHRQRHRMKPVPLQELKQSLESAASWSSPTMAQRDSYLKPDMILEVERTKTERRFPDNGSRRIAFHGTSMENLHSILHNGLLNLSGTQLQRTGAVFGNGIYLAEKVSLATVFSKPCPSWPNSSIGERISCLLVCEVFQEEGLSPRTTEDRRWRLFSSELPSSYILVDRADHVRILYVLIYSNDRPSLQSVKSVDVCKAIVVLYILFMLYIGVTRNSLGT